MNELTAAEKLARLEIHLREWRAALYDAEVNAKVGKALGDAEIVNQAQLLAQRAIRALDVIAAEIAALN